MKKNYVKKCLMVSMALSMTVATVTFADTPTADGYANEQETGAYTTGTPELATQDETVPEEPENPEKPENTVKHYGWYTDEETGNTYYYDTKGNIQTGWKQSGNTWYYLDGSNTAYPGRRIENEWKKIKNIWYYFWADGIMATGWQSIDGSWYYLKDNGAMTTGWIKLKNVWYYLNSNGTMATGWNKIGNKWYYLKDSGVMTNGWQKVGNTWYYMNGSGAMLTGWQKISNKWYYLKSNGAMATGWQKISGKWYYMNGSGAMLTGWNQIGGKWYYMYSSGAMASNTWIGSYYVNGSGVWTKTRRSYPAGNYNVGSVYGPSLTQRELDQVADAVQKFIKSYNFSAMNDYQKIRTAMLYLESHCTYAADWSKNRANTAWGALVYHEAQCSGYARGLKALCDGIGIGCYYVHANSKASNPSHQWNEVRVNGQWYITDPQLGISTLEMIGLPFLMSESTYSSMFGMAWDHTGLPNCPKDYK